MMSVSDEIRINVRTSRDIKRDLEITARLRGLTVSALVNLLVVRAIREEKQAEPSAFSRSKLAATITPGNNEREEIRHSLEDTMPSTDIHVTRPGRRKTG